MWNYIVAYWTAIQSGKETVGKWIKNIYQILVEGLQDGIWSFNERKADKAIKCRATFYGSQKNTIATNYFL